MNDVKELIGKVILFNDEIEKDEVDFDSGMKARVTDVSVRDYADGGNVVRFEVDFSEFAQENIGHMKATYWPCFSKDPEVKVHGFDKERLVKWVDTTFYPKNCKNSFYLMESEVLNLVKFSVVEE